MNFSQSRLLRAGLIGALLAIFLLQLAFSIRRQSQTYDEGFHLVAGYRYWQCGDFGINPEHPPLVKVVAAAPLWLGNAAAPLGVCGKEPTTKDYGYGLGIGYLFRPGFDGDALLYRARLAAALFAVLLGVVCYLFARFLFGAWAGIIALALLVFEPSILAHGALVTTDTAVTAFILAAVFSLNCYYRRPSFLRLAITGILTGLSFASKHSGTLIVPVLLALGLLEFLRDHRHARRPRDGTSAVPAFNDLLSRTVSMAAILLIGVVVLWAVYGLRYSARPGGEPMSTPLGQFILNAESQGTHGLLLTAIIPRLAKWQLLPEAYLYGLVDVLNVSDPGQPPFLLGTLYPQGQWFYFPIVFVIKSTLGFLALLVLALIAGRWRAPDRRMKFLYLVVPPMIVVVIAMQSGLNIGYRHVLPIVPFLCILSAGGAVEIWYRGRGWQFAVAALLLAHVVSSLRSYPNFLPYSNEAWGGTMRTYRYLTDSNVDWGQGLYQARDYINRRSIKDCWLAYDGAAVPASYGIPCRKLPANAGDAGDVPPPEAEGVFILSHLTLSGIEWEPGELNPYRAFFEATPSDNIAGALLVYQGKFDLRDIVAVTHIARANNMIADKPADALAEARAALALTPNSVRAHLAAGRALVAMGRKREAEQELLTASFLAEKTGREWYPLQLPLIRQELEQLAATAGGER